MGDQQKPDSKAVPNWRRRTSPDAGADPQNASPESSNKPADDTPGSRATLIEQASQFLEDPVTRHATMERKMQFLESKGLTNREIFELLGIARKEDAPAKSELNGETEKAGRWKLHA